jgi:hypothetical protein
MSDKRKKQLLDQAPKEIWHKFLLEKLRESGVDLDEVLREATDSWLRVHGNKPQLDDEEAAAFAKSLSESIVKIFEQEGVYDRLRRKNKEQKS